MSDEIPAGANLETGDLKESKREIQIGIRIIIVPRAAASKSIPGIPIKLDPRECEHIVRERGGPKRSA